MRLVNAAAGEVKAVKDYRFRWARVLSASPGAAWKFNPSGLDTAIVGYPVEEAESGYFDGFELTGPATVQLGNRLPAPPPVGFVAQTDGQGNAQVVGPRQNGTGYNNLNPVVMAGTDNGLGNGNVKIIPVESEGGTGQAYGLPLTGYHYNSGSPLARRVRAGADGGLGVHPAYAVTRNRFRLEMVGQTVNDAGCFAFLQAAAGKATWVRRIILRWPGLQTTAGLHIIGGNFGDQTVAPASGTAVSFGTLAPGANGAKLSRIGQSGTYGGIVKTASGAGCGFDSGGTYQDLLFQHALFAPSAKGNFAPIVLGDWGDMGLKIPASTYLQFFDSQPDSATGWTGYTLTVEFDEDQ